MANTTGVTGMFNCPNFVGPLFLAGANQTPFLNMIGGLNGGAGKTYASLEFPVSQPYSLNAAAQPDISETDTTTAPTANVYVRELETNSVQAIHEAVQISYIKMATTQMITADGTTGLAMMGNQPVADEIDFQIMATMEQIAVDTELSFLAGTYQKAISTAVGGRTRGIITATTTNAVAATSATLSKALISELLISMGANGARFRNSVIFANGYQLEKLTDIYSYAKESTTIGGTKIEQIYTNFGVLGVVYAPQMPTDTLLIAEMSVCSPVFSPVPGKGLLFYEEKTTGGAVQGGEIFGLIGLDYGSQKMHGKITGLATS